MNIKSLGILGLGSRSTLFYIRELNRLYHEKKAGYSTCTFKLWNVNFDPINKLLPQSSKKLEVLILNCIVELQQMKIDALLIPNITLHETVDALDLKINIIHPVVLVIAELKKQGIEKVVLFGSLHSMETDYIKGNFKKEGIEVLLPSKEDRILIDTVRKNIYAETETPELLKQYNNTVVKYTEFYPVVLACTELSIAWNDTNGNVYDMALTQIRIVIDNMD